MERNSFMDATTEKDTRFEELKKLYPELVRDGKLNTEALKDLFGEESYDEGDVGYNLYWPGKRNAMKLARKAAEGTLEPVSGDGVNEDKTNNIYIEGDNLEVLRCLKNSYGGRIKMIYIDPPYNTGKDFIYPDSFAEPVEDYLKFTGQVDEKGVSLVANPKSSGAYHRKWLDMMLPRLKLAYELLVDEGVIFVSIDDNEQANLKLLCDEVFGEENFCGQLIIQTATDNNPRQICTEHEYMMCYAKNKNLVKKWIRKSELAQKIKEQYEKIKIKENDVNVIQEKLRKWINEKKRELGLKPVAHYNNVDEQGVYSSSTNSSNPHPGGYMFDIMHPITQENCPRPANGWRWPERTFWDYANAGQVEWGKDHTTQPHIKQRIETATDALRSIIYEDNRASTKIVSDLFDGEKIFDNPKSVSVLTRIIDFVIDDNDIIMDFFSGSATTAHAVMQENVNNEKNLKFIMVQLPVELSQKNEIDKNAVKFLDSIHKPHTICEIGKERIRRAGKKIIEEHPELKDKLDVGFKVYRLAKSNIATYKPTTGSDQLALNLAIESMENQVTPLRDGFDMNNPNDVQGLLVEIILRQGFALDSKIEKVTSLAGNMVYRIEDEGRPIVLHVCLDEKVKAGTVKNIAFEDDDKFICLNSAISDELYAQLSDKGRVETI